jgi:hypothetical protein
VFVLVSQQENPRDTLKSLLHRKPYQSIRAVKDDLTNRPARFPRPAHCLHCGMRISECGLKKSLLLINPQSATGNPKSSGGFAAFFLLADLFDDDGQVARDG